MPMPASRKNPLMWIVTLILVVVIVVVCWMMFGDKLMSKTSVDTEKYQAVFLNSGQVYFGKITEQHKWLVLTNVYYLQRSNAAPLQEGAAAAPTESDFKLVKLGSELHGPEDAMYIERSNVWFWENMKEDSKVLQAIKQYQAK